MNTWIVVASSTKALIYKVTKTRLEGQGAPELIKTLTHPESRLKETELLTGSLQGHHTAPFSTQGTYEHHADVHREEQMKFARELAHFLNQELNEHHYEHLVICAEPRFYGLLKEVLSEQVLEALLKHVPKDYIPLPESELNTVVKSIKLEAVTG